MTSLNEEFFPCRICGFNMDSPVRDEFGLPDYDICPCCGAETGLHDNTLEATRRYRENWIRKGQPWSDTLLVPPDNWNLEEQMKNIQQEWR